MTRAKILDTRTAVVLLLLTLLLGQASMYESMGIRPPDAYIFLGLVATPIAVFVIVRRAAVEIDDELDGRISQLSSRVFSR